METKTKLGWQDLKFLGEYDKANRWYPNNDIKHYFDSIRSPSRRWPHSYAKAAMTLKFAKFLKSQHPKTAAARGL